MTPGLGDKRFRHSEHDPLRVAKLNLLLEHLIAAEAVTLDDTIAAFAALVGAADQIAYFTGPDTMALTEFTVFARSILDDADAGAVRTTIGLGTAAVKDTGTFGDAVPILNAANSFSATQTILGDYELVLRPATTTSVTKGQRPGSLIFEADSSTGGHGQEIVWRTVAGDPSEVWAAISGHIVSNGSVGALGAIGDIVISTKTLETDTALTERMRIKAGGLITMGFGLEVAGGVSFSGAVTSANRVTAAGVFGNGLDAPTSGAGIFIGGIPGDSLIQAFNYNAGTYDPLNMSASYFGYRPNGGPALVQFFTTQVNINGELQCDSLRIDETATAAAAVPSTHTVPINVNGTAYRMLVAT